MATHLILGGAGFMGSHLAELLLRDGQPVRVFDRPGQTQTTLGVMRNRIELHEGDFRNGVDVERAVRGADIVFHLVGTTVAASSNRDPVFDVESNLVSTLRLLEVCVKEKIQQVIFSSSGGTVYGPAETNPIPETHPTQPLSSYGITKLTIEKYLALFHRLHGLNYTVLRISNAYGPRLPLRGEQNAIGAFLTHLKYGETLSVWGDGSVVRDYVYVADVARAFRAAAGLNSPFHVFNVGTGVGTSLINLIHTMEQVTGRKAQIDWQPARPVDAPVNVLDCSRAREYLGWQPTTNLTNGLRRTWEWILQNPNV
jgi:UDP-glucose 4-epimerase